MLVKILENPPTKKLVKLPIMEMLEKELEVAEKKKHWKKEVVKVAEVAKEEVPPKKKLFLKGVHPPILPKDFQERKTLRADLKRMRCNGLMD